MYRILSSQCIDKIHNSVMQPICYNHYFKIPIASSIIYSLFYVYLCIFKTKIKYKSISLYIGFINFFT